jgi:cholesterol oxidase
MHQLDLLPGVGDTIRNNVGPDTGLHVISHCLGAVSFSLALFGGTVTDEVTSAIVNSVSLRPRVAPWSKAKLWFAPFLVEYILGRPYVSPRWRSDPYLTRGKLISYLVSAFHSECDYPACHMLSFMWGTGYPALYSHDLIDEVTHDRGEDLYGPTAMHYHRHVRKMVGAGHRAVKYDPKDRRYDALPDDYLDGAGDVEVPVLFCTGEENRVFMDSNILAYETMKEKAPGRHELATFAEYGHQDVFMGNTVDEDIFPTLLDFLEAHRS